MPGRAPCSRSVARRPSVHSVQAIDGVPLCGWHLRQEERLRGRQEEEQRPGSASAHPPDTQRPAEVSTVKSHEAEEPERALHPKTGPTRMAQAVRLQPAQHGENASYRYKTIMGRDMRSRCIKGQRAPTPPPGQNPGLQEDSFHGPGLELPASGTLAAGFDGEADTVSAFRVDSGQAGALPVHENLHDAAIDEDSQLE